MPKCKIDYERSEIRNYQNDADKDYRYLRLTLVPVEMNLLAQAMLGANGSSMVMLFYPQRDSESNIDSTFEEALIKAFEEKKLGEIYADKIDVEIPPTLMTYGQDTKNHSKGDWVMDGENPRITTSIRLATLTKIVKGEEVPIISENELKARAIAIRNYRIDQGEWFEVSAWQPNTSPEEAEIDPADVDGSIDDEIEQNKRNPTPNRPAPTRPTRR